MKKNYVLLLLGLCCIVYNNYAQTTLSAGDIAIIGIDADDETFAFVTLTDIETNTTIFFTDSGVTNDGSFRATEGAVQYTASTSLVKGSVVQYSGITGDFSNASDASIGANGFNLSSSGDQVIAFTGSVVSPNFIFAAQTNSTEFQIGSNDSNQSDLPPGLIVGLTAVAVGADSGAESEFDNSVYNLSITNGTKTELLAAIANNANWNGSNTTVVLPTSSDFGVDTENNETPSEENSPTFLKIHEVQGVGVTSPFENKEVTIEGVIVGDFQHVNGAQGDLNGFFIQEEDSDADTNIASSEAIFVFEGNNPITEVDPGDLVRVTGTVVEFFGATQLSMITDVEVINTNQPLPVPLSINLPLNTTINSNGQDILDLEFAEGMLVTFSGALMVNELFNLDRFGEIKLIKGDRPFQYTQLNKPSVSGFAKHLQDIASRSMVLDDGLSVQNPDPIRFPNGNLSSEDSFRMGDTSENITGVVAYSRGSGNFGTETYRIHPTIDPVFTSMNRRLSTPESVEGTLKIANFNVLNFFTTLNQNSNRIANGSFPRGANNSFEYERQLSKLVNAIIAMDADVIGLLELENDFSSSSSGNAIKALVMAINKRIGSETYDWVNPESQFVGGDAIANGFIYKKTTVEIAPNTSIALLTDDDLTSLGLSNTPAVFNGPRTNRVPIAVSFKEKASQEVFTAVINHFKSKGSEGNAQGDENINNGVGSSNQTRLNAAIAVSTWLKTDPTNSGDDDFLILGDLNAYAKEDPITYLESEDYTDLVRNSVGDEAYSFVFDGQTGTLDYALANTNLQNQVASANEWHINADEADAIDYNTDFGRNTNIFNENSPARSSDHDPVIIGLNLDSTTLSNHQISFNLTNTIKAYPIPFKDKLNVEIFSNEKIVTISILNISTGAEICSFDNRLQSFRQKRISVPVKNLSKGLYILKIKTSKRNYHKLIAR